MRKRTDTIIPISTTIFPLSPSSHLAISASLLSHCITFYSLLSLPSFLTSNVTENYYTLPIFSATFYSLSLSHLPTSAPLSPVTASIFILSFPYLLCDGENNYTLLIILPSSLLSHTILSSLNATFPFSPYPTSRSLSSCRHTVPDGCLLPPAAPLAHKSRPVVRGGR